MKKTVVKYYCDLCNNEFDNQHGILINEFGYTYSNMDALGGSKTSNLEMCQSCSRDFLQWINRKKGNESA